jgi:nitroimidazol reductase NimA-like FMN-containing flavoprotein (pyridoxamine 5'-phosphate oxidase superfamily)
MDSNRDTSFGRKPRMRKMHRIKQQLTDDECREILVRAPRGVLSLIGDEGYPYGLPINFLFDGDKVYFHSARIGYKIDALKACNKASFCVMDEGTPEGNNWWLVFRSVIVTGTIRLMDFDETARAKLIALGNKYYPDERDVLSEVEKTKNSVQMLELSIESMTGKTVREN